MSAIPPLSGDKPTSDERVKGEAIDPKQISHAFFGLRFPRELPEDRLER
jgi:hypothetical protein